jgi:hypothetical protein
LFYDILLAYKNFNNIAKEGNMAWRGSGLLGLLISFFSFAFGQELTISTAAKNYSAGEEVWVNLSVLKAPVTPGAYVVKLNYDAAKLSFRKILPAESGPFSITPSVTTASGVLTVAGFQGVADTGSGSVSLVTLVFIPIGASASVDTSTFSITSNEVYTPQAQQINVILAKHPTSVMLPSQHAKINRNIRLTHNYVQFSVLKAGLTSIRIFDLGGRLCATPLAPSQLSPGRQAVPLKRPLTNGMYVVSVNNAGYNVVEKLEVLR